MRKSVAASWKQKLSVKTPSSARVFTSPQVRSLSKAGKARLSGSPTTRPSPQMLHCTVGSSVGAGVGVGGGVAAGCMVSGVSHPQGPAKNRFTASQESTSSSTSAANSSNSAHVMLPSSGRGISSGRENPASHRTQRNGLLGEGDCGKRGHASTLGRPTKV